MSNNATKRCPRDGYALVYRKKIKQYFCSVCNWQSSKKRGY